MVVAHFFAECLLDDLVGLLSHDGEIGGAHPVNKIPFQHRGVASDDPTLFVGGKLLSVWARPYEVIDCSVYVFLERRRVRPLGSHKTERFWGHRSLLGRWCTPARHVPL